VDELLQRPHVKEMGTSPATTLQPNQAKKIRHSPMGNVIISAMWQGLLLMWEDQNNDQHGRDSIELAVKERETLLKKIHQLYNQKESIDPEDRRLYHLPENKWQEETSKKIREWINLAEPLTKNTKKKSRTRKVDPTNH
jgi:hypothetical protein